MNLGAPLLGVNANRLFVRKACGHAVRMLGTRSRVAVDGRCIELGTRL